MTGARILIVDDNPTNLRLAEFALSRSGYQVSTAHNAESALDELATLRPAVILMDLQLPGIDGFELTRRLRADSNLAGVRIIAFTAFAMAGDEERALAAGCDGYISKPVMPERLRRIVAEHAAVAAGGHDG